MSQFQNINNPVLRWKALLHLFFVRNVTSTTAQFVRAPNSDRKVAILMLLCYNRQIVLLYLREMHFTHIILHRVRSIYPPWRSNLTKDAERMKLCVVVIDRHEAYNDGYWVPKKSKFRNKRAFSKMMQESYFWHTTFVFYFLNFFIIKI